MIKRFFNVISRHTLFSTPLWEVLWEGFHRKITFRRMISRRLPQIEDRRLSQNDDIKKSAQI